MGYLGRYYTTDAPIIRRTRDSAQKTLVCEFQGQHYVAEREGSALRIYTVHDENGLPAARIEQTLDEAQVVGPCSHSIRIGAAKSGILGAMMETDNHAKLAAARAKRDAVRARCEEANKAADAAVSLVSQAEAELARFDGLQDEIAQYRANAIKRGKPASSLSDELVSRKEGREEASSGLDEARAAHALLATELEAAKAELTRAGAVVANAAEAILHEEANALLADLKGARAAVVDLEDRLFALGCIWVQVPGEPRPKPFPLPPGLLSTLQNGARPYAPITVPQPSDPHQRNWAQRYKALRE